MAKLKIRKPAAAIILRNRITLRGETASLNDIIYALMPINIPLFSGDKNPVKGLNAPDWVLDKSTS